MEECGESCSDKPEIDKLRRDTLEALEQQKLAADDAASFVAALGNEEALTTYISSCAVKKCEFRNEAIAERDTLRRAKENKVAADAEERQFKSARGNISALKKYAADCQVCAFARQAAQEIDEASSKAENSLFKFKVCNNDYSEVSIAVAGKRDSNSNMLIAEGWWNLSSGECKVIGTFAKGHFYYTAYSFSRRAYWPKKEYQAKFFCIPDQKFTLLLYDGHECTGVKRGFAEAQVSSPEQPWNLNSVPWSYSALAYSPNNNSWGWGTGYSSRQDAENRAMQECLRHAGDCRVGQRMRDDYCLALASGSNDNGRVLGWSTEAKNYSDARIEARQNCRNHGGISCAIVSESFSP